MSDSFKNIRYGEIILPDNIHVAAGREMNLWWSTAAVYEEGDRSVYFEVKCDIGINSTRGFIVKATPEMIGVHDLTIRSRDLHTRNILSEKKAKLHVVDPTSGEGQKNILMIGDSRTWHSLVGVQGLSAEDKGNKTTTTEVKSLLETYRGADFHFVGSMVSGIDKSVRNLAENGWRYVEAINTIEASGGIVPYVEDTCGEGKGARLDYVTVMYGMNDYADWHQNNLDQYDLSFAKIDHIVGTARKLVDLILEGYPDCRIVLILESSTCGNQDGFAYWWNKSTNDCQTDWEYALKELRKAIIKAFDNGAYTKNLTISTAGLWCDRIYAFPYVYTAPSERTPDERVFRLINCAHPHDNGYKQIADGDFSTIKYLESLN